MRRITFCLVCGTQAPAGSARCPDCDAPLGREESGSAPDLSRRPWTPLFILCALAIVAVLVAILTYALA